MSELTIRPARPEDSDAIWAVIEPTIRQGTTYTLDPAMPMDAALSYWLGIDKTTFVALRDGNVVGTYYIRTNQDGGGKHVANCGYMTLATAQGSGVARAMCLHSLDVARRDGYRAMQFNFVVSTNVRAVGLWTSLGFNTVGRLPLAFRLPTGEYVDALVMYRPLAQ
jgi:ribosomal protein S18 acetylase RimI-like enzyme